MTLKPILKNGEFPSCEKCIHAVPIETEPWYVWCCLYPRAESKHRESFCVQGRWEYPWSKPYAGYEDAYSNWEYHEQRLEKKRNV